jgi:ribosome-associated toxin RatA of RatAB toxin-antitoxin module
MLTVTLALLLSQASSDTLTPLLMRGPVALVEQTKDGKFQQATAIVLVNATPDQVYVALLDHSKFKNFMPKVLTSEVVKSNAKGFDVRFVIDVPGPDTDYTIRYVRDDAKHVLTGTWLSGDLKDSKWEWKIEPTADGKSLLSHALKVKNFSSVLTSLEDERQTMTVGVNVSSAIAATTAVKNYIETPPDAGAGASK